MQQRPQASQPLWYEQAEIYDLAFAWDPQPEVAFLSDVFEREGVKTHGLVFEPFMGSGRLWPGLLDRNYRCAGFDFSHSMVRRARQRLAQESNSGGHYLWQGDAAQCAVRNRFDAAHCLIDSFRYLRTMEQAHQFMKAVARGLKPNAPFVLGLELHQAGAPAEESWSTQVGDQSIRSTIFSHGNAGPDLQWMDVKVEVREGTDTQQFLSRGVQRIWQPRSFLDFIDDLAFFDVASLHRRTHDITQEIDALPLRGGPVIVVLVRNEALMEPGAGEASNRP